MVRVFSSMADQSIRVTKPGTLLGRSIFDGIAEGIDDSANNLLHGVYDDDDDFGVDPLCQLGGDRFTLIETLGKDVSVPGRLGAAESVVSTYSESGSESGSESDSTSE